MIHYVWKVLQVSDNEEELLITPHGDPYEYEYPFDFLFDTIAQAWEGLITYEVEEEANEDHWILCKQTVERIVSL